jgi:hypothetical protein
LGEAHPRLRGLPAGVRPPLGTTPVPDRATLEKYEKFAGSNFLDPEATIDVIAGRPRIWQLRQAPIRIQVADPRIVDYTIVGTSAREVILQGGTPGTTVINLWFGDPNDAGKQRVLRHVVQVAPCGR